MIFCVAAWQGDWITEVGLIEEFVEVVVVEEGAAIDCEWSVVVVVAPGVAPLSVEAVATKK